MLPEGMIFWIEMAKGRIPQVTVFKSYNSTDYLVEIKYFHKQKGASMIVGHLNAMRMYDKRVLDLWML